MTWEKCKYCEYCYTQEGESGWYCNATDEQLEECDAMPCKQESEVDE